MQLAGVSTRLRLPARMVVYREESIAHWVFIIAQGVIKSYRDLPSGKRRVMSFLFQDDIFGLAESGHYVNTTQASDARYAVSHRDTHVDRDVPPRF